MKELKITKGDWKDFNIQLADWSTCGVGVDKKSAVCHLYYEGTNIPEEAKENAKLIADAGTTANKCGLLPSELLEQRNELLNALKLIANMSTDHAIIRFAIKKYKKFENWE